MQADFTDKYNTKLSKDEEKQFNAWVDQQLQATGRDWRKDMWDYDIKGAWKSGAEQAANGHLPDTFKKPNHPTFSDQSEYHGKDGYKGGTWGGTDEAPTYKPSKTNLKQYGRSELEQYFKEREPNSVLEMPEPSKAEKRYGGQ